MPYDQDAHAEAFPLTPLATLSDVAAASAVSVRDVRKRFGRYPALGGVSLEVKSGELLALLGPSGSGKTTLLRTIAGLEFPDSGEVLFGDRDVTYTPASDRGVGFVFQQYALFANMTVAKNIAFGLDVKKRRQRPSRAQIASRVDELLNLVELRELGGRFPSQLSGGQRQRVALARALAVSPRVLLLDEPFGALDATVRRTLRRELRQIHDAAGVATVFVTHDQEEALELADRVAVLSNGVIEQIGSPKTLQNDPASAFVAGFVGGANRFEGRVKDGVFFAPGVHLRRPDLKDGAAVAFVRPEQLQIAAEGLTCVLVRINARGVGFRLEVKDPSGRRLELELPRSQTVAGLQTGAAVAVQAQDGQVFQT